MNPEIVFPHISSIYDFCKSYIEEMMKNRHLFYIGLSKVLYRKLKDVQKIKKIRPGRPVYEAEPLAV